MRSCQRRLRAQTPPLSPAHPGDLVDAKDYDTYRITGRQYEIEWQTYRALLDDHGRADPMFWLDMRGNHDVYGVLHPDREPFWAKYGVQGARMGGARTWEFTLTRPWGVVRFVSADLSMDPGTAPPTRVIG